MTPSRPFTTGSCIIRPRRPTLAAIVFCCLVAALSTCDRPTGAGGTIDAIHQAFGTSRIVEPRLSAAPAYAPCPHPAPLCAPPNPAAASDLAGAAATIRSGSGISGPGRLTAGATLELAASLAARNGTGASVSFFEAAAEAAPLEGARWSDLAAAYLVRAESDGSAADAVRAIDAAEDAVDLDPSRPASVFNLALALEHLGLRRSALRAWRSYLRMDSTSGWSTDARGHVRRIVDEAAEDAARAAAPPKADTAFDRWLADLDAGRARLVAMDDLLPTWGRATLSGDSTEADRAIDRAARIGSLLSSQGGDRTVERALAEIRTIDGDSAAGRKRRREMARAYDAYGRARQSYAAGAYQAAAAAFAHASAMVPDGAEVLRQWLRFYHAVTTIYTRGGSGVRQRLEDLVRHTDSSRFPALTGRAVWGMGSIALRSGRFQEAESDFGRATALFLQAGELENAGATRELTAEAGIASGQSWSAVDSIAAALRALNAAGGASVWLHNLLDASAGHVEALGYPRAALAIQTEGVEVAEEMGNPIYLAEALLARARLLARAGRRGAGSTDLRRADSLFGAITDPVARRWIANDRAHTMALIETRGDPAAAAAALPHVASFFATAGNTPRQAHALLDLADALRRSGNRAAERRTLGEILRIGEKEVAAASTFPLRASLAAVVRKALVEAVDYDLDAKEPEPALDLLNRWSAMRVGRPEPLARRSHGGGPRDGVGVAYLLTGSAVAIWVGTHGTLRALRVPVDPEHLGRLVSSLERAAELGGRGSAARGVLAELWGLLIAPAFPDSVPSRIHIYAAGQLSSVPFAALYDPRTGRYLVQDAVVEYETTPSAAMAASPHGSQRSETIRALVVAADSFAETEPLLPPLPGARGETEAIARDYSLATVLGGKHATPSAVTDAAKGASVLHFAGHAVMDVERPWSSHLVLAADSIGGRSSLDVTELRRIASGMDVVVLAACRSASPGEAMGDGFGGFADALLSAGVGTVIGSIWDVPDRDVSTLLEDFHHSYARGAPPAEALRQAQLDALGSGRFDGRFPYAWAGFRAVNR